MTPSQADAYLHRLGAERPAGRVHGDEGLGIPYDHLALRVRPVHGGDLIADVGFGAHSQGPLDFGELGTDEEVLAVYRDGFGIGLSEVPTVRGGQFG